ncbi:MAG: L-serine ammonia-lyase, iron-sulfur-dependent, subunit alpha [Oscillospiraceae bacterium]
MFELNIEKLLLTLEKDNLSISQYTLNHEVSLNKDITVAQIKQTMFKSLEVMRSSTSKGMNEPINSVSGLTGSNSYKYAQYLASGKSICGDVISLAMAMALSCSEVNASMNRIVACPTAGSCGIVPAALFSVAKKYKKTDEELIDALFTAAGVGVIIGAKATLSGAEGGCQAECGSAAAMGAAALVELMGGTPKMAFHAAAMAFKNVLGLVCDPVAGLVEIPCIKRNASGTVNAITCADLALSGVESYIPFEEVVDAMYDIGKNMSVELRETALGGLAVTPTGISLKKKVLSKNTIH